MRKTIVIINGKGTSGKDTIIDSIESQHCNGLLNVSSIEPIEEIVEYAYRNKQDKIQEKSLAKRKLYSDLKKAFDEFSEFTLDFLKEVTLDFIYGRETLMFVHIRELENIAKFIEAVEKIKLEEMYDNLSVKTLLIIREEVETNTYGNSSDDNVNNFKYDIIFNNSEELYTIEYYNNLDKLYSQINSNT